QVATTALATSEVAWPIRHLLRKRKDVTTLLANVTGVDRAGKRTGELEAAEPRADNDDMMPGFVHFVHLVSKIACPACRY
ncbi:hypothetical protein EN881_34865, partial [Mesorhizobium sp. M7A.F.Ca.AU.002.04.1.1]